MEKRLLFITRHRLNENNGGSNGSKGFIRCFSELFNDCTLIYPEFDGPTSPFISAKYKLFPCRDRRSNVQKGLDCYRGVLSPLSSFVAKHLKEYSYDVIVIDHSFIGARLINIVKATEAKIITIHHNVERDYLNDNRQQFSFLFRMPYIYYAKKAERECLVDSDVNLTVTENDSKEFKTWYPDDNLHVYNWGNFEYKPFENKMFPKKVKGHRFVITGSLNFMQSLYPILEFVRRYWPLVMKSCPDAQLTIAGRNPARELQTACSGMFGVTIVPNPTDMSAIVLQADYYICPINAGSGRKLRVMDGLRQGLPVLCHRLSASGYECMMAEGCLFPYSNEQDFTVSLTQMLSNSPSAHDVYQIFKTNYSINTGTKRLKNILSNEHII